MKFFRLSRSEGLGLAIAITTCVHASTDLEGENVCRKCARVLGYSEIESVTDWKSHNVGFFGNPKIYWLIVKTAKNLHLPQYATQTIIQISSKLLKKKITRKQSIFFATVYSCRIHSIPRLLEDIFCELENASGKRIKRSEKTLLKLLNKITKKIDESKYTIHPPNKDYYLQAYLAKIQEIILNETNSKYFELLRVRSTRSLNSMKTDPSTAAKIAILQSTSSIMRSKIKPVLL